MGGAGPVSIDRMQGLAIVRDEELEGLAAAPVAAELLARTVAIPVPSGVAAGSPRCALPLEARIRLRWGRVAAAMAAVMASGAALFSVLAASAPAAH